MASWPSNIPSPQKTLGVKVADNNLDRKTQSGRCERRSFGTDKPEPLSVIIRFLWVEWEIFRYFYTHDLNHGINWFSASWLTPLGYATHKAKIIGYPREFGKQLYYIDVLLNLIVQDATLTLADVIWPCASTGTTPTPPPPSTVYGYTFYSSVGAGIECNQYIAHTDAWSSKTNCPLPSKYYTTTFASDATGFVCGGTSGGNLVNCDAFSLNSWSIKLDILLATANMASATHEDFGFIFGGTNPSVSALCYKYDIINNTWVSGADLPSPKRFNAIASTLGNKIYVAIGATFPTLVDCDEYNPILNSWLSKTDVPLPERYSSGSFEINNMMFVVGGYPTYYRCDEYAPLGDTWTTKTDIPNMCAAPKSSDLSDNGYLYNDSYTYQYYGDLWLTISSPSSNLVHCSCESLRGV